MSLAKVKKYLPMIIGILLTIPLAIGAFFLTQGALTRAGSTAPVDIKVSKTTSNSAEITWTTDKESTGVVEYGTSPKELVFFAPEAISKTQHSVEITLLQTRTPYYFVIRIGDTVYNKDGIPYTFTTKGEGESVPATHTTDKPAPTIVSNVSPTVKLKLPSCIATDDCTEIQKKFGKGCSTSDYIQCLKKKAGSQPTSPAQPTQEVSQGSPTPTFVPAQTNSPTPTP